MCPLIDDILLFTRWHESFTSIVPTIFADLIKGRNLGNKRSAILRYPLQNDATTLQQHSNNEHSLIIILRRVLTTNTCTSLNQSHENSVLYSMKIYRRNHESIYILRPYGPHNFLISNFKLPDPSSEKQKIRPCSSVSYLSLSSLYPLRPIPPILAAALLGLQLGGLT